MTYLFDGSIMKPYLDYFGIPYEKVGIRNGELCPYYEPNISKIANLINLYEGTLNESFEQKSYALSASWYKDKKNAKLVAQLKNNMDNYFRNILHANVKSILWSTFLSPGDYGDEALSSFGLTRYDSYFVSCNVRGTNKYAEKSNVAYMINVYLNPGIQHFFEGRDIRVNASLYALQYMLQWIWRSRIRNYEPINLYVPSKRMRNLLKHWMDNRPIK